MARLGWVVTSASLWICAMSQGGATQAPSRRELIEWGMEALERIRSDLYLPDSRLYAEEWDRTKGKGGPAFMWSCGVMLSALNAAASLDKKFLPELERYIDALDVYWNTKGPVPGYDCLPCPKPVDRYYDDNAWMVLAFLEAKELLRNSPRSDVPLKKAESTMTYVLSGLDDTLGGGIYWRETDRASKNTCSNAPSAFGCYKLFAVTNKPRYRELGNAILDWTLQKLRDPSDLLMWDNISLQGKIEKTKWSYNTALVIRSLIARAGIERNSSSVLLNEAVSMAEAGLRRWQDSESGAFKDDGAFAHLFAEALLELDRAFGKERFRPAVLRALAWLHEHARDPEGRYPKRWDSRTQGPAAKMRLLDQASAARGFLFAALPARPGAR